MKCPYCSAAQGRCATTSSGRSITECGACGRVMEERHTQSHHLFHLRAQDTPLCLSTSDLPTPPPPASDAERDEDPFEKSGFLTAFSTWSLEHCPVYALSSFSFSGHLAELERALEAASNPNSSSTSNSNGVVVDNLRAYLQIVDVASILGLEHDISDHAFQLFRDCSSATCLRNRSVEALATACLVQAIRQAQEPRTLQEISIAANLPQKEIGKYLKILGEALQLSQPINSNSISVHMPRFCNLLQLNKSAQELATHIGEVVMNKCFCTRRNPISISAAAIYLACQLEDRRKTQAEICKVTGLTEVTLRKVYKELLENWDDLLPSNYTPVVPPEKAFPTTTLPTGRSSMARVDPSELVPLDRDRNPESKPYIRPSRDDPESKINSTLLTKGSTWQPALSYGGGGGGGGSGSGSSSSTMRLSGDSQSFQGIRIKKFHATSQEGETKFNKEVKGVSSGGSSQFSSMQVSSPSSVMIKRPPLPSGSSPYAKLQHQGQLPAVEVQESGNQNGGKMPDPAV